MKGSTASAGMPGAPARTTSTSGVSLAASGPTGTRATEQIATST
jgi:hypothetical protein